jgi:multimeric flavodoxin WrbA
MKVTVLNGSPKGTASVTMQYVKYIEKMFPEHDMNIINISQKIKKIERDENYFNEIIDEIESSQAVLWAFPLYVFAVPGQYKRFIELITEKSVQNSFKDKYTAVLTTSIHFFDHTAHNYMNAVCDDLYMKFIGSYSAAMEDLFNETEREKLKTFAGNFFEDVNSSAATPKNYWPILRSEFKYQPSKTTERVDMKNKRVAIVTDSTDPDSNLSSMVKKFMDSFDGDVKLYNLNNVDIKGGCLGCLQCAYDNVCVYEGKDGFIDFYKQMKDHDAIIFAGTITDRYLSSKWKYFFDRGFFNTHIPVLKDKQLAYIISGPLGQNMNLREMLEGHAQWQHANVVNYITDEYRDSNELDSQLEKLAGDIIRSADSGYVKPVTFLGVGGMLLFRDAIYGKLRFPFKADHDYFKKNGLYNFPQKDYKTRITNSFLGLLVKIPNIRREIYHNKMKYEMIKSYKKIVEE